MYVTLQCHISRAPQPCSTILIWYDPRDLMISIYPTPFLISIPNRTGLVLLCKWYTREVWPGIIAEYSEISNNLLDAEVIVSPSVIGLRLTGATATWIFLISRLQALGYTSLLQYCLELRPLTPTKSVMAELRISQTILLSVAQRSTWATKQLALLFVLHALFLRSKVILDGVFPPVDQYQKIVSVWFCLLVKTLYERSFLALPTLEYGSFRSETDRLQIYVAATVEIW